MLFRDERWFALKQHIAAAEQNTNLCLVEFVTHTHKLASRTKNSTMLRGFPGRNEVGEESSGTFFASWARDTAATTIWQRSIQEENAATAPEEEQKDITLPFFLSIGLMGLLLLIWCVTCCRNCIKGPTRAEPPAVVRVGQVAPATGHSATKTQHHSNNKKSSERRWILRTTLPRRPRTRIKKALRWLGP